MEETRDIFKSFVFEVSKFVLLFFSPEVQFCGYTVPHPAESKMHFRIQLRTGRASDTLKRGLDDLVKMCDHTLEVFNTEVEAFKTNMTS